MINFNINVLCLALQKFLPASAFIENLNITNEEYIQILVSKQRNIQNFTTKIGSVYHTTKIKKEMILQYIGSNQDNTIKKLASVFKYSELSLIKFLDYIAKENIFLIPFIFEDSLYNEIKNKRLELSLNEIKNHRNKIFKSNQENTEKLLKMSDNTSIETLALTFNVSPYIISKELIFNKKGGFWENENIRTNAPFFISDVKNNFSIEELFFIFENIEKEKLDLNSLSKKLSCTIHDIEFIIKIIQQLEKIYTMADIKEVLAEQHLITKIENSNLFQEILNYQKDNSSYIYNYHISELLTLEDKKQLEEHILKNSNHILNIKETLNSVKEKAVYIITKHEKVGGILVSENEFSIDIKIGNQLRNFSKQEDILLVKNFH